MEITHFVYEVTPYFKTIDMIVTSEDADGHPMGYEVWKDGNQMASGSQFWIIDDEPTIIIHPIESRRSVGRITRGTT